MRMTEASGICARVLGNPRGVSYAAAMPDLATKIRHLRQSMGQNQAEFARRFDVTQATVSRWEKGSMPEPSALTKIAELMEVEVRSLLDADFTITTDRRPRLQVKGAVAAGVWREAIEWPEDDWVSYTGGAHIDAPMDRRFGLVVEGDSMNEVYPPGTILDCVSTIGSGMYPQHKQRVVIVRRRIDGDVEATVKEYRREADGREWLVPRSYNPAFQTPIELGSAEDGIEETTIMAIVRGAYLPE